MVLTKEQEQMVADGVPIAERTGLIDTSYRWPNNIVYYTLSNVFDQDQVDHIIKGLRELERVSCLRFVERTTEVTYVEVTVRFKILRLK